MQSLVFALLIIAAATNAFAGRYYDANEAYAPPATSGVTYYVDGTNGTDPANCASPGTAGLTEGTAYKTVTCSLNRYASRQAGARVLVKAGRYFERVSIPKDWPQGTSYETGIKLAAFGNGEVVLDGGISNRLQTWTVHSGAIHKSVLTSAPSSGITAVVVDNNFKAYHPKTALISVVGEGDWFYDSGTLTLYVWKPAAVSDLNTANIVLVENHGGSSDKYGINILDGTNYVTVSGLTVQGCASHGIYHDKAAGVAAQNIKIDRNVVRYNAKGGVYFLSAHDLAVSKNLIYGNVIRNWPRGMWNAVCANINSGGWPVTTGGSGVYNSVWSGNIVHDNGGEGHGVYVSPGPNTIEDNIFYDNWSANIYADQYPNAVIRNNLVYSTEPNIADARTDCSTQTDTDRVVQRIRPEGIMMGDEAYVAAGYSVNGHNVGAVIHDNIVVNCRRGITYYRSAAVADAGIKDQKIYNNTIVTPAVSLSNLLNDWGAGISLTRNGGNNLNSEVKNNIIYSRHTSNHAIRWLGNGEADDPNIAWDNNLVYRAGGGNVYSYKQDGWVAGNHDLNSWRTASLQGANDMQADPLFVGSAGSITPSDYQVSDVSPTTNSGVDSIFTTDFNGNARVTQWDIGAFEYGGVLPPATPGTAPTTTPSKAPGRYLTTQQLSLTASAGTTKYCFGAGCTPTATYSAPIKVLQNLARQTVRVQSVDGNNVETVQTFEYRKQRLKGSVAASAPVGWTVASTFEGGTLGAVAQGGNGFPIAGTKTTFSNTLAHSGTTSAKVHWDIGDEGWMAQHGEYDGLGALEATGEVWYRAYHYFPAGFDFTAVNVNKLMRLQSGAMWNSVFVNTDGTGDGKLVMSNEPSDWQPDLADSYMARGEWHAVEIYTKFGAPGIIRIWLDGVLKGEDTTRDTGTWGNRAMFMSNWNGTSPSTQDHYVDDVVITSGFNGLTPQYDAAGNKMIGVAVP